jgi:hypothetical protein
VSDVTTLRHQLNFGLQKLTKVSYLTIWVKRHASPSAGLCFIGDDENQVNGKYYLELPASRKLDGRNLDACVSTQELDNLQSI